VRVIDQLKGDLAAQQMRLIFLSIGLLMAVGIPLYFKVALEIGDNWTVALIFFGGIVSLNALRGLLKKKILGWGLSCLGIALTLQYLLIQYGSHPAYDLLQLSLQTILAKILIFLLISIALPCLLLAALRFRTPRQFSGIDTSSNIDVSSEKLGQVTAFLGFLVALLQFVGTITGFFK
jgi:hypothetical protein